LSLSFGRRLGTGAAATTVSGVVIANSASSDLISACRMMLANAGVVSSIAK
jgi:hypothetical protein